MNSMKIVCKVTMVMLTIGITSCDDFLDKMPDKRAELNTPQKVQDLLVSAYPNSLPSMMFELMSDNATDNGSMYQYVFNSQQQSYLWINITDVNQDSPNAVWSSYYLAAATANQALEAIADLGNPESCAPLKAEALLCRAYAHFVLVNTFCMAYNQISSDTDLGIPYPEEPETVVNKKYERGTVADVYAKINRDIEEALPLLKDSYLKQPLYHFNKKAAYAFAARFNLYYLRYDKAVEYANVVLGNDPAKNMRDPSKYMDYVSPDDITMAYINPLEPANLLIISAVSSWGLFHRLNSTYSRYGHAREIVLRETLVSSGPWGTNLPMFANKVYGTAQGYYYAKMSDFMEYVDEVAGIGYTRTVQTAFTVDETLLTRAEAYAMRREYDKMASDLSLWYSAKSGIRSGYWSKEQIKTFYQSTYFVNKPMNPRFIVEPDDEQKAFINACLHARRLEAIHEGLRWLDIKRYGIEIVHPVYEGKELVLSAYDTRTAIQLPPDVLAAGMEANPRY
ncbi:hypothetical protein EZS27_008938 [termite gut metagenome]|uniref:SusD-like N-terminal domain-containing protein n=1 Tax=termite gut metagenome TaxID=433724 RepID=A0A5J4SD73_9ZZZZ